MTINGKQKRIKSLDIEKSAKESIFQAEEEIIDQQNRQFDLGERSDGSNFASENIKFVKDKRVYHYRKLYWTGAFRKGLEITKQMTIDSKDPKSKEIRGAIGDELFGLSKISVKHILPIIKDFFFKKLQ